MNRIICRWAFRESFVWVLPVILAMLLYVLLKPSPIRYFDGPLVLLGIAQGGLLGFRIFWDGRGVRAFLFSRSFSPGRFFMVRWLFGLGVLAITWATVALLLGGGVREAVQTSLFQNGWFPMIRRLELQTLPGLMLISTIVYQSTVFFVVRYRFFGQPRLKRFGWWSRLVLNVLLGLYTIPVVLMMLLYTLFVTGFQIVSGAPFYPSFFPYYLLMFGIPAALQTLLIPLCGRYCYCCQEIES